MRRELDEAAETVRDFRREHLAPVRIPESMEIKAGDRVRLSAFDEEGDVLAVEDGFADVQMGTIKLRQPLDAMVRLGRTLTAVGSERRSNVPVQTAVVPIEIDFAVIGRRKSNRNLSLSEQAYRSGNPFARIIHGKGTGALWTVVRDLLKRHPAVERFENAAPNEGGDGATVAFFQDR